MTDEIEEVDEQESFIAELLKEFRAQRDELMKMVDELAELKKKIDTIFPEQINNRNKFFIEDKIKVATELFKGVLDIRKEITRGIKDEIEIRRRIDKNDALSDEDLENMMDMSAMARKLDDIQKKKNKRTIEMDKKLDKVEQETRLEDSKK